MSFTARIERSCPGDRKTTIRALLWLCLYVNVWPFKVVPENSGSFSPTANARRPAFVAGQNRNCISIAEATQVAILLLALIFIPFNRLSFLLRGPGGIIDGVLPVVIFRQVTARSAGAARLSFSKSYR